ncbi:MAG: FAD-dependent oxidoreductase, partial [Henriciella sp.]
MTSIAIIGSGISGLGAAYALRNSAEITVFEARAQAGGHAYTVDI